MGKLLKYYDYCHEAYEPLTACRKKLSSDRLFYNSLEGSSDRKAFLRLFKKIRQEVGPWNTVWGVKWARGQISWELYFYNHGIKDSPVSVTHLLRILSSYFKVLSFKAIDVERIPYFMVSVDLGDDVFQMKAINGIHLYTPGRQGVLQGASYHLIQGGCVFENHYDFYHIPAEEEQLVYHVRQNLILSSGNAAILRHVLVKALMRCGRICVAHKKEREGLYFSRVNVRQLIVFLEWFGYPEHIVSFFREQQARLDHLLYDVAFDCALRAGKLVFDKSSYYSVF